MADILTTSEARASAAMVLTHFDRNIQISAAERLIVHNTNMLLNTLIRKT